jgi:PHP family Zn ribbon phosphoesterase
MMKNDLISRSALLKAFGEEPLVWDSRDREDVQMHNDWLDYTKLVKDAPTIEAEPVRHGRWVSDTGSWLLGRCSQCREIYSWDSLAGSNYCPNCGAKMDGGGGE